MNEVFVLHHPYGPSESETYKLIGVFSEVQRAKVVIQEYLRLPGFRDYPEGFGLTPLVVDAKTWQEGFGFDETDDIIE